MKIGLDLIHQNAMIMRILRSLCLLFIILSISGCDGDTNPPNPSIVTAYYPYMINDVDYNTVINVYNKSDYSMELDAEYRTPDGVVVVIDTLTLSAHASTELSRSNFTGSVQLTAVCDRYALQSYIEIKRNDNQGAALAQKADRLYGLSVSWFYHLGINDMGPGDIRSSIITANPWYPGSIFTTIAPLSESCADISGAEILPKNLHIFKPMDVFSYLYPGGMEDLSFYVQGKIGSDPSASGLTNYTGAHFIESPNGNIGLVNYKYQMNWVAVSYNDAAYVYLVDLHDNDIRQDRIILKRNGPAGMNPVFKQYTLHFYDQTGTEVSGSPCQVSLEEDFNELDSYDIISPMDLLGQPFTGSVWIDPPADSAGYKIRVKAGVIKQSSDQWRDITDNSPTRNQNSWGGAIAHVSTNNPGWHYSLALYYPGPGYIPDPISDPGAEENGDIFCDPGTVPPDVTGGQVVLKLYDEPGNYLGALAIFMLPNETRYIDVDDLAETYLNGSFTGSIEFLPHISQQLEIWHDNEHAHGSTGNWADNQYQ